MSITTLLGIDIIVRVVYCFIPCGLITYMISIDDIKLHHCSSNDVELGSYRGPVHNKDVVEIIHIGTQKLLNRLVSII